MLAQYRAAGRPAPQLAKRGAPVHPHAGLVLTAGVLAAFKMSAGGGDGLLGEPDVTNTWAAAQTLAGLGSGDLFGALLWAGSSYFVSPLQVGSAPGWGLLPLCLHRGRERAALRQAGH